MAQVEKIYSLKTLGFDQIMTELDALSKKFVEIKKAKQDAAKTAADTAKAQGVESQAYKDAAKALDEQKIKELELKAAIKEKTNEAKAAQLVRQEEANRQKAAISGNAAEVNSIGNIRKARAELNAAIVGTRIGAPVEFRGLILPYQQANDTLKRLTDQSNAYSRQFQKDGTLVGEYTTGIVQAFKSMGIDDLVTGQVTRSSEQLRALNEQFETLKQELVSVRSAGQGSFDNITNQLNIVRTAGISGFEAIEAKIKEIGTSGGTSLEKIEQVLTEIRATGNGAFSGIEAELTQIKNNAAGAFTNLEKELIDNRKAALALEEQIGFLQTELRGTGDIGNQITAGLSNGFKELKGQFAQFVLSYVGFQAAFQGIMSGIETTKELSDQTTNLEIELGKSAGGADRLVSALAKLNTRTPLTDLENIANIAAKAGVSEENLLGVTEALDKIKIAFGKDFGDVESGTESLVKLINVFEGTDQVTGDNLLKAGNAVRTLANESVASVPFLNDFAQRMAGLKGISDIALPAVLGLASGFEQFGQSSEVAGTALTKIIPKLATDTAKYGDIAGMTQKAFSDLLKNNPAEALIKVSEGLVKGKAGIEEISTAFADSQLGSGRIAAILGTVGSKADDFRKSIASAGAAFNDTGNIEAAFQAKNENLASTMDKISKAFKDAANSTGFRLTLTAIAGVISFLINNMGLLITVLGTLGTAWAVVNAEMIKGRVVAAAAAVAETVLTAAKVIATTVTASYSIALNFLNTAFLRAAASSAILRAAISVLAGPIGIIIGVISLLAISAVAFGNAVGSSVAKLKDFARQQAITNEITKRANAQYAEQTSVLAGWVAVIKSAAAGADTKRSALQKLIEINPAFRNVLQGQTIDLQKLDAVYKQITESIRAKANADASASLTAEKQKDVLAVTTVRQRLETEFSRGTGAVRTIGGLSDDEIEKLFDQIDERLVSIRKKGNGVIEFQATDFARIQGNLKRQEDAAIGVFNDYVTAQGRTQAKLAEIENKAKEEQQKNADKVSKGFEIDVTFLKGQIDDLNKQIDAFQGAQKDLSALIKKRNDLQAQYDKALGNQKATATSRLSAPEKDLLAQEDARRDLELTLENKKRVTNQEDEETYLKNILHINQVSIDNKLTLIKGDGIAEQKLRAQLSLDRITLEKDTQSKIQEIHNKEFTERQTALKNQLDEDVSAVKQADAIIQNDPNKSSTDKAQSKLTSDSKILELYRTFNVNVDRIEKEFAQQTTRNSREIVKAQQQTSIQIISDRKEVENARLTDIQTESDAEITEINIGYEKTRTSILQNEKLTSTQRQTLLENLNSANNITVLSKELDTLKDQLRRKALMYAQDLITEKEYEAAKGAAIKAAGDLEAAMREAQQKRIDELLKRKPTSVQDLASKGAQNGAIDLFNVEDKDKEAVAEATGAAVAGSFALATDAMHNYYDAERARIQQSLELNLSRLDAEEQQVKARAKSQAEIDSIDKQYAAKKLAAQKAAGEETKKTKRAELKIALVTELANDAVAAAAYPFPFSLAIFGVMSALALGRYALGVSQINAQQFAYGGDVPKRGGKFGGKPHSQGGTKFGFQHEQYEAEVDELAIIRTRNAPARNKVFQIQGTHQQIASQLNVIGGGVSFAPGAKLKRFDLGGNISKTLSAPVFVPSSSNNTVSQNNNADIIAALTVQNQSIQQLAAETSKRFERIEVVQVTSSVTRAQQKQVQQKSIGTL